MKPKRKRESRPCGQLSLFNMERMAILMVWSEIWDSSIHSLPEQVKRRLNGEKIKADAITVNVEDQTAVVIGSDPEPYRVSLSECSCFDFASRELPCKHIYRLASELGMLEDWPKVSRSGSKAALEDAQAEIERWRQEFLAGNISAKKYIKIADALMSK